ncbi:hypothetical protein ACFV1N_13135 [Streptosporangium canum]|uniref:hypothetical protein n=1 Tax=Streptosporangium canum TaxID=324952 RepID=UPI0036A90990
MNFTFAEPASFCLYCGCGLETRTAIDRMVYLNWTRDRNIDRVACSSPNSPDKKHSPRPRKGAPSADEHASSFTP